MESNVDPKNLEAVRELLRREKIDLIHRFGAEGVAIGKATPGGDSYVIVVYVAEKLQGQLLTAAEINGVPLRFEVTGKFRPH